MLPGVRKNAGGPHITLALFSGGHIGISGYKIIFLEGKCMVLHFLAMICDPPSTHGLQDWAI